MENPNKSSSFVVGSHADEIDMKTGCDGMRNDDEENRRKEKVNEIGREIDLDWEFEAGIENEIGIKSEQLCRSFTAFFFSLFCV